MKQWKGRSYEWSFLCASKQNKWKVVQLFACDYGYHMKWNLRDNYRWSLPSWDGVIISKKTAGDAALLVFFPLSLPVSPYQSLVALILLKVCCNGSHRKLLTRDPELCKQVSVSLHEKCRRAPLLLVKLAGTLMRASYGISDLSPGLTPSPTPKAATRVLCAY